MGPGAQFTNYEDALDPSQQECPNKCWNSYYMKRNAAINLWNRFGRMRPGRVPVCVWMLIKTHFRQPMTFVMSQQLANFRVMDPVTVTSV